MGELCRRRSGTPDVSWFLISHNPLTPPSPSCPTSVYLCRCVYPCSCSCVPSMCLRLCLCAHTSVVSLCVRPYTSMCTRVH